MDFLIGVMIVIICILLLFNFASFSISDNKFGSSSCAEPPNYLIQTMQYGGLMGTPSPVLANNSTLNSGRVNQSSYNYDYSKYFFVS